MGNGRPSPLRSRVVAPAPTERGIPVPTLRCPRGSVAPRSDSQPAVRALSALALRLLALVAASGLLIFVTARAPGAARDLLVLGHAAAALVLVPIGVVQWWRHLAATGSRRAGSIVVALVTLILLGPAASALHYPEPIGFFERQRRAWSGAWAESAARESPTTGLDAVLHGLGDGDLGGAMGLIALSSLLGGAFLGASLGAGRPGRSGHRNLGVATTAFVVLATATAIAIPIARREQIVAYTTLHSVAGLGVCTLVALHALLPRWQGRGALGRAAVVAVSLLGTAALWWPSYKALHFTAMDPQRKAQVFALVTSPPDRAARAAAHQDPRPAVERALASSFTCGGTGCHEAIVADWEGSAHRYASSNTFYRAALRELVTARGPAEALACAACHDPSRAAAGTAGHLDLRAAASPTDDGVGCASCHAISHVWGSPPANGRFSFAVALRGPADSPLARASTRLDPRPHRERFLTRGVALDATPCQGCHRFEVGPDIGASEAHVLQEQRIGGGLLGGGETNCISCHLPTDSTGLYRHRMAGIAADLGSFVPAPGPAVARYARAVRDFTGARVATPIDTPTVAREDFGTLEGEFRGQGQSALHLRIEAAPVDAAALRLDVRTLNLGIGHAFPSGPFDLQRTWLEVHVTDGRGRTVAHLGDPVRDPDGDDAPLRLGAKELRADGSAVPRHRLFELHTVSEKQQVGRDVRHDVLTVPLDGEPTGPFHVRARWLFRRVNVEFEAWARAEIGTSGAVSIWDLASAETTVPSARPGP